MIFNYGSLNIDYVYSVCNFVRAGETISSASMETFPGGKGLNQSVALASAGALVRHCGFVSANAGFLTDILSRVGVDISLLKVVNATNGHAIIQVNSNGENCILLHGGTNQMLDKEYTQFVADKIKPGDLVIFQNEVSMIADMMRLAKKAGAVIVLNPSPMNEECLSLPMELVDIFILNEVEGECLTGSSDPQTIIKVMAERFFDAKIILTLGVNGALFSYKGEQFAQPIVTVGAVADTTAAGDTFMGFYLAGIAMGETDKPAMYKAAVAAGIAVTKMGAASSIPTSAEVDALIEARSKKEEARQGIEARLVARNANGVSFLAANKGD